MMLGDGTEKMQVDYEQPDGTIVKEYIGKNMVSLMRDNIEALLQPKSFFGDFFFKFDVTSLDRKLRRNCARTNGAIIKLIEDRKAGKIPGWSANNSDILSVLMRNEHYTDNTVIANECLMMFTAGSKTV